ncbi:CTD phosphatase Fcp1 [Gnomoniopsis smithogilvyi]|uniref:RNA polymerase II subunit A C-terminal domain phosphatase n=1 Tax=Gnomoniopsis smithogilvyi TaxID=1191159 RepID=A0A9W8YPT1_9PEZI|nr:CTD phosphatase Fcp1 [Gnomoniopsis smithogilvyi]
MSEPIPLGPNLRYPITISKLVAKPGDDLKKGATAMEYSFKYTKEVGDITTGDTWEEEQTSISSWGAPVEGKLKEWKVKPGQVITGDRPCCIVEEACQHPVQISGLCAICGKDVTEVDWSTERSEKDRAPINMTHDQVSLTVSHQLAQKVELEAQARLLEQKKLSLVVDLDQTIIHACIDPTVGEWQKDPTNPNHAAVADVQSFQLNDDGPRGGATGCSYYIKMRPGLRAFLEHISQLYELHVYTMGTRAYAMNIAKIVDPDQKLFGNRIISRDENGSMTAKSLQRIFPVSQQMVVIIDDRADVWPRNRPNLIKVVPYDFFKGVGDINSSFLPKPEDALRSADKPDTNGKAASVNGAKDDAKVSALEGLANMSSGDDPMVLKRQKEEQERALEKQLQDRPLLHMQEEADKEDTDSDTPNDENQAPASTTPPPHRHQVLFDDDQELTFLEEHLTLLHTKYYEAYATLSASPHPAEDVPDVGAVLDELKAEVLRGTRIVLSGLIPLGVDVYRSEIGLQVLSYGADLRSRIDPDVTHLVISSSRPRTQKVRAAARIPTIKIVNQGWLQDSISRWEELDETPYLVELHPADQGPRLAIPEIAAINGDDGDDDESADDDDVIDPLAGHPSPIDDLKEFDFQEIDEELEEFLADATDDESAAGETEVESDTESRKSEAPSEKVTDDNGSLINGAPTSPGKRKHELEDDAADTLPASGNELLNKKLKLSRERGPSSLKNGAAEPDAEEEVVLLNEEVATDAEVEAVAEAEAVGEGDDDFDDELEADLLAELDREELAEENADKH